MCSALKYYVQSLVSLAPHLDLLNLLRRFNCIHLPLIKSLIFCAIIFISRLRASMLAHAM